ncbi:TIGR02679 family protein [Verminephrobacter eiseniae]|uniref:TIGR02679 family protein n=1 Tax=Verminephrobacter eiseniae TaxID=364317 RepID=UPI0022379623|nr:TIGR02679 family protein [Verminephrobacter eiseniae]
MLKRLARRDPELAMRLLGQAGAVLRDLPASGLTRAQLAAKALGDAHALDGGQPAATLVLAALRHHEKSAVTPESGLADDAVEDTETGKPPERERDIWARAGVLVNELARPALLLNLPVHPSSTPPGMKGEPDYLSLRRLLRTRFEWAVERKRVYVCENPNILSIAADRLGAACSPLVCTDGMPAAAQRVLLTQLADAGAELHYHGDFDWAGICIANHVMQSFNARPWRFGSGDYVDAFASIPQKDRDLMGDGVSASWDPSLLDHMRAHQLAVDEEAVAHLLIGDLERQNVAPAAPVAGHS